MARSDCPKCDGTGWMVVQTEGQDAGRVAVRCECTPKNRTAGLLERARVPQHFVDCDFDSFDVDISHEGVTSEAVAAWNRSLSQAKVVAQGFARDFPVGVDSGLLFMGPFGVGKTHLAVAVLKEIVLRGHFGLFYDYNELLKEIQSSWNPDTPVTETGVLEPVLTAEVLLLDDLGAASKPSLWALETVSHILNSRYNEKRVTLVTTSFLDDVSRLGEVGLGSQRKIVGPRGKDAPADTQWSTQAVQLPSGEFISMFREDTLTDRVGKRIRSRLYEMCRTVEMVAPDYRKEIRQAGRSRA